MRAEVFLMEKAVFRTKEFADSVQMGVDSASRLLKSYQRGNVIQKVTRGVWINPRNRDYTPYGVVPYLLDSEQGYVSFISALHRHNIVSQIPQKILAATTGHGRTLKSAMATYEFIQIKPEYMQNGVTWFEGGLQYGLASPEKALLDCLYVSTRRGRRFLHFPELDFKNLKKTEFERLLKAHQFPKPIHASIQNRFDRLWNH